MPSRCGDRLCEQRRGRLSDNDRDEASAQQASEYGRPKVSREQVLL